MGTHEFVSMTLGVMQKCYTNGGRKKDWVWYCDGTKKVTKELAGGGGL